MIGKCKETQLSACDFLSVWTLTELVDFILELNVDMLATYFCLY